MTTKAYGNMRTLCTGIEEIFPSAVCVGIVGDRAHRKRGGPHISRQDQPSTNWSCVRPQDRKGNGPDDAAAGFDIAMNRRDMTTATRRLIVIWSNPADPRRKYLNAFNGWLGSGDARRYDVVARTMKYATPDHRSHLHGEVRRLYVLSKAMVKAVLSALRGQSLGEYLKSIGVQLDPPRKSPAVPKYPGQVLAVSDKAVPAVALWQARMRARGWTSIGKADGVFGPKTLTVVRRYQQLCKVDVDGTIGPQTWPLPWRPLGGA